MELLDGVADEVVGGGERGEAVACLLLFARHAGEDDEGRDHEGAFFLVQGYEVGVAGLVDEGVSEAVDVRVEEEIGGA